MGSGSAHTTFDTLELHGPGGARQTVQLEGRVQATQVSALHALCMAGWGICMAVRTEDFQALADGRLVPVLPDWHMADLPVYAVTQRRGEQPAKVRHALEVLGSYFAAPA